MSADLSSLGEGPWADALAATALFAVDPLGTGGVVVRARCGPARDRFLMLARRLLADRPLRRLPLHAGEDRVFGGIDLAATLAAGRPVMDAGFLAEAGDGVILVPLAERLSPGLAARLASALDRPEEQRPPSFILIDEGSDEDERPPAALADRLAFPIDLSGLALGDTAGEGVGVEAVGAARSRLAATEAGNEVVEALAAASMALGVASVRPVLQALKAGRAAAALAGRPRVSQADAALAARLILAPRATRLPPIPEDESQEANEPRDEAAPDDGGDGAAEDRSGRLEDVVLDAARAAIPADLLDRLRAMATRPRRSGGGRGGASGEGVGRGRPAGTRRGRPDGGHRLDIVATLRAAAPWQAIRRRERQAAGHAPEASGAAIAARIDIRRDDLRIRRVKRRTESLAIFAVDASGSAAFHRLAEVKGAVELVLADCYVRRDQVALVAFRDAAADILLPPTRSLARAKRSLAGLPGGGRTPLAAGVDAALALADAAKRGGRTPTIVLMTDGRANTARDGRTDKARAFEEALGAARAVAEAGFDAIVVDTSPRPRPEAERLAAAMAARYVPLPYADAVALSMVVKDSVGRAP